MRLGGAALLAALAFAAPESRAANDDAVKKAIDRGVASLRKQVTGEAPPGEKRGRRFGKLNSAGEMALVGLTLVECGVKSDDPVVKIIADDLRPACVELDHTYSLALAVMFFDRLGDVRDRSLIQSMGVRLLAGQNDVGGWGYNCPRPSEKEIERLKYVMLERQSPSNEKNLGDAPPPASQLTLPKELQDELDRLLKPQAKANPKDQPKNKVDVGMFRGGTGDNSNTQFAILGMWVAHRHGVPMDKGMAKVEKRFQSSQGADGSWGYTPVMRGAAGHGSGAMTCAGLLGLAMAHGTVNEAVLRTNPRIAPGKLPRQVAKDPQVRAGLLALGTAIGQPNGAAGMRGKIKPISKGYYFLWSIERVAVAYGLTTIGTKDWYAWGSELLLASQGADGSWEGEHGKEIDTSFALLFLRRVNLARDLTEAVRGVADPGTVTLKVGGVGGDDLLAKGLASGIVLKDSNDGDKAPQGESARLTDELIKAPANKQEPLIDKLKDGKGVVYTEALAAAIPHLTGSTRTHARDALAERLTRMKAGTLRDKLQDEDVEVRRAAVVACYMKDDKEHIPDLIAMLEDKDEVVLRSAVLALKSLTSQDHGPAPGADAAERRKSIEAWKAWLKKQPAR